MKALQFVIWLKTDVGVIRHSKEGDKLKSPSNGELRRWITNGAVRVNNATLKLDDEVQWPITDLVLFPNNKRSRVTLVCN